MRGLIPPLPHFICLHVVEINNAARKLLIGNILIETGSWILKLIFFSENKNLMEYVLLQVRNVNLSIDITNNYFSVHFICDLQCTAEVMFL